MNNADFDYSLHYRFWHQDTPESRRKDIAGAFSEFKAHHLFPPEPGSKILEIGCGMGRVLAMLCEEGYTDLYGIDLDASQIEVARKEKGIHVSLMDAAEFVKGEAKYDAVYLFDVLEHVDKEKQLPLLRTLAGALSENGFLVIRVPNADAPLAMRYRYIDFEHTVSCTDRSICFLLANAGLMFAAVRPQRQESPYLQYLKLPWARLYRNELGQTNPILTLNLIVVAFKNEAAFRAWESKVPVICNDYPDNWLFLPRYFIRKLNRPIRFILKPVETLLKKLLRKTGKQKSE